jgi:hypothetical protein
MAGSTMSRAIEADDCAVEGCDRPRQKKGGRHSPGRRRWCAAHAKRIYVYGDALPQIPLHVGWTKEEKRAAVAGATITPRLVSTRATQQVLGEESTGSPTTTSTPTTGVEGR